MRKLIFAISLLLLIFILGLISSNMAPVYKASAAGALDHIVFSNISTQRAGTAFDLAITAVDVQNSTVTSYVETNTLNISTGTISPTSTSSFKNGSWTGQVTLTRAATGVTISTSGSNKTGTSNSFAVNPGALASFNMTGYPTSVTAGTSFGSGNNVIVTTFDAYGNTKTDYRGSVYFTSTDTQAVFTYSSGSSYTFTSHDNGVHTFAGTGFILKTSGPQTIRATDGTIFKDSTSITVNPGALASFTITGYPTSVTSGQNLGSNNVVVTAYDGYGNIKTDYVGSVYFDSTDAHSDLPFTSGNKYTFTSGASQDNGVHTFAGAGFTLKTTPSQTITVTDGSRSATSNSITVNPKPVTTRSIIITSNPTGSGYIRVDGQTYVTPATFNWTIGNMHTISADSPVIIISNQSRYIYSSWSDSGSQSHIITVSLRSASTFTANFRLQYYLFVSGGNGNGAGWYNSNASASSTASYVLNQVPRQSRNNLYQKIVDGIPTSLSRANSGTSTQSFTMSTYHTITWSYRTQYYLTNSLLNGSQYSVTASPTRDSWYDAGTSVSTALNNVWGIVTNQSRSNLVRFFNGTVSRTVSRAGTGTATFTIAMTTYRTINDTSVRQYYLSLTGGGSTSYGTASPTSDSWYDNGTSTTVTSSWVWNIVAGRSRTAITSYTIDGSSQSLSRRGDGILTTPSFSMTTYHTVAFSSTTQYFLNVTGGYSVSYGTASPTSDNWYDSGSSTTVSSLWVWNTVSNQSRVAISNWQLDGINQNPARRNSGNLTSTSISMLTYHRFNFVSTIQYYFTVSGGNGVTFGTVSQTSDNWYDSGTSTTVSSNWAWNVVSGKNRTAIMNWQLDSVNQTFLFSNGFENGTGTGFTAWDFAHASGTGSTTVDSLAPHSGTSDAKFVSDAGGYSHCGKSLEPSPVVYARAYYNFSTLNLGSWDRLGLLRLNHGNYTNSVTAQILYHDGNYYWEITTSDGVNSYHDQSVPSNITTGVWYCIEIKRDVINGQEQLWVNGVNMVSAAHNITGNTDQLEVGITYGGNVPGSGNICYVDDIAITGAYDALGGSKPLPIQELGMLTTPSITMSTYHQVKLRSISQFYLTVNSTYGMAGGIGWYDSGSTAYATLMNGTVSGGTGIRYIFMSWAGDASGSGLQSSPIRMDAAKTATANWKKQYFVVLTEGRSVSTSIVDSNSTVTGLAFNSTSRKLSFTVSGASGTTGHANITIAKSLIGDINSVMVYLDENPINLNSVSIGDSWLLQFTYQHSNHKIDVSLGSTPATTGSPGLGPLTPSMISMIGVISGIVLLVTVAWSLLARAFHYPPRVTREFPQSELDFSRCLESETSG